jgi:hypothetical protein
VKRPRINVKVSGRPVNPVLALLGLAALFALGIWADLHSYHGEWLRQLLGIK